MIFNLSIVQLIWFVGMFVTKVSSVMTIAITTIVVDRQQNSFLVILFCKIFSNKQDTAIGCEAFMEVKIGQDKLR